MNLKTRTLPAVSEELVIPKPAPGENVYPIFSQGVICGYVYSGGNQKKPKIFLTEDNQEAPDEEKPTKMKNDDLKKTYVVKTLENVEAKGTATQPVNRKFKKKKKAPGKTPSPPNNIDSKVLKATLSDDLAQAISPTKHAHGDPVDLGRPRSAFEDGISIPVLESPSKMALSPSKIILSPAKKNVVQMTNPIDASSLMANPNPPVVITSASPFPTPVSYVTADAKNRIIFPKSNCGQQLLLPSNNPALQSTNWLSAPIQQHWPNNVTYFLVPAGAPGQGQVLLASSANSFSNVMPSVTNPSVSRTTTSTTPFLNTSTSTIPYLPTTTASTVDSSVLQLSSTTTSTATPPFPKRAPPQVTSSTDSNSQTLSTLSLKGVMPKSTYVQMPPEPSLGNQKMGFVGYRQPIPPQFKMLKLTNLEIEKGACKINPSPICPDANDEKASKESASFGSDNKSQDFDGLATELPKDLQEKTIDSTLSANSEQTNNSEESSAANSFNSEEDQGHYYQVSVNLPAAPIEKKRRGRPRKIDKKESPPKNLIPILPATQGNQDNLMESPVKDSPKKPGKKSSKITSPPIILFERMCKNPALCSEPQRHKDDCSTDKSTKNVQEIMNNSDMNANSNKIDKSETSSASASLISQKKSLKSLINTKPPAIHMKKRQRAQQIKDKKCDKLISSATGSHLETESPNYPFAFNLLPSGKYVLGSQNEVDKNLSLCKTRSKELNENLSEKHKEMTFSNENKGGERGLPLCNPSLCEVNEMPLLPCENGISIKPEPLDYNSGVRRDNGNLSDNSMFSTSANAANIQPSLLCKEERMSEDETMTIQEDEENQLVISSCFSLTSHTESDGKLTAINSENSDFNNIFFRPRKMDTNDSTSLDDRNVENQMEVKESKVQLEQSSLLSNSLIPSSVSSSKEEDLPCTKPAENVDTSPKDDKSNIQKFDSSLKLPTLTSKTKRSLEALAKNIIDQGCLKKMKENYESVDLMLDSPVITSSVLETGIKRSLESPVESIYEPECWKKLKENDDTKVDSSLNASTSPSMVTKKSPEVSAKTISDMEHWKNLKEKNISDDKIEIPFLPNDEKVLVKSKLKSKSLTVTEDVPSIPTTENNYLKATGKQSGTLQSDGESMVIDLTDDGESDAFIEGCIAFHEQQLYMLKLQMEQHKTSVEKLRKELMYRKSSK